MCRPSSKRVKSKRESISLPVNSFFRFSPAFYTGSLSLASLRAAFPLYNELLEIYARFVSQLAYNQPIIFNYLGRARVPVHNFLALHFRFGVSRKQSCG